MTIYIIYKILFNVFGAHIIFQREIVANHHYEAFLFKFEHENKPFTYIYAHD